MDKLKTGIKNLDHILDVSVKTEHLQIRNY